jgi:hypothetical protein
MPAKIRPVKVLRKFAFVFMTVPPLSLNVYKDVGNIQTSCVPSFLISYISDT